MQRWRCTKDPHLPHSPSHTPPGLEPRAFGHVDFREFPRGKRFEIAIDADLNAHLMALFADEPLTAVYISERVALRP